VRDIELHMLTQCQLLAADSCSMYSSTNYHHSVVLVFDVSLVAVA